MAVEADLRLLADLRVQRLYARLGVAEHQGAGRVDDVHALRAGVDHDAGLCGEFGRPDAVRQHEEPDRLQAEPPGRGEVLHADVGLGAVRGDARDLGTAVVGVLDVADRGHPGQHQERDAGLPGLLDRGGDQRELVGAGEAVVEARAAEAVAVAHLDHPDVGRVERGHDAAHLSLGELVAHGVAAVAQRRVGDADRTGLRDGFDGGGGGRGHDVPPRTGRTVPACSANRSPMRTAAAVMMSRLPA